jgi:hypothetical protein
MMNLKYGFGMEELERMARMILPRVGTRLGDDFQAVRKALESKDKEIERLRAALEKLLFYVEAQEKGQGVSFDEWREDVEEARKALEAEDG